MCTGIRFTDEQGTMYFGHNFDTDAPIETGVLITPHGFKPISPYDALDHIEHATIGMGYLLDDSPLYFDCANEAGLAVAALGFAGAERYADAAVEGTTNVASWEFPLWAAASFASVDELEAALAHTTIVNTTFDNGNSSLPLHWFVGDATRSIAIECTKDGLQVFDDTRDVLTGAPALPEQEEHLMSLMAGTKGMEKIPGDCSPSSQFVRAEYLNSHYPVQKTENDNMLRAFHTLNALSLIDGSCLTSEGRSVHTTFSSCYCAETATYYYSRYSKPNIEMVCLDTYNIDADVVITANWER